MELELDYMEYANDAAAQAAYASSDIGNSAFIAQILTGELMPLGDIGNTEYRQGEGITLSSKTLLSAIGLTFGANVGAPAGDVTVRIETEQFGTPTGNLADPNLTKVITPSANQENIWTFATPASLPAGKYFIVTVCDDQATGNYWQIRANNTSQYAGGGVTQSFDGGASWGVEHPTNDLTFKVFTQATQCFSEDTIKKQGSYSLNVAAQLTDSLNDTLTKTLTGAGKKDLSGMNSLEIWAYASRTGTNIEIQIHDSGGATTTKSIAISSAGMWEKTTWDISGVADVDKDDIDSIIVKITNADALNVFYIDYFFGIAVEPYPIARLNRNRITGYHCFMDSYLRAKRLNLKPLKLPDGTSF